MTAKGTTGLAVFHGTRLTAANRRGGNAALHIFVTGGSAFLTFERPVGSGQVIRSQGGVIIDRAELLQWALGQIRASELADAFDADGLVTLQKLSDAIGREPGKEQDGETR